MSTKKIQTIIICSYIGMMLVFSGIVYKFYFYVQETTGRNVVDNQEEVTKRISEQTDNFIRSIDNIALQVMGNEILLDGFAQVDDEPHLNWFGGRTFLKNKMQNALMKINGPLDQTERICVYNEKQDYISYGVVYEKENKVNESLSRIDVKGLTEEINQMPYSKRTVSVHTDYWGKEEDIISVFRILTDAMSGNQYGVIEVQRPVKKLREEILLKNEGCMEIYILDAEGNMVLPAKGQDDRKAVYAQAGGSRNGRQVTESGILTWNTGEEYGWKTVAFQSGENLLSPMKDFRNFVVGAITLFSGISIAFFILFTKKLLLPIKNLSDSANKVNYNNLELKIQELKGSEVDRINQAFQAMFERLKVSMDNEVKSRFWAMQAQMNPHFLYNTLSVISAAGIEEDSEKVPFLCEKLSSMLRYSSSYEQRIEKCTAELDYVEDYLALMNERYGGQIDYTVRKIGRIENIEIPKISIQPFVENCFKHGFRNKPFPWKVQVTVEAEESGFWIRIEDNGCGLSQKQIRGLTEQIQNAQKNPSKIQMKEIGGMGLINTVLRFQLICREKIFCEISGSKLGGALIVIRGERDD